MQMGGSKELKEQVLDKDLCTVCGACVDLCPYFKAYNGKVAQIFECDLTQGRCFAHCPKTGVDFEQLAQNYFQQPYRGDALGFYRRITAARAGEKLGSGQFQNGGTVSALVTLALESGLIEGAVLTDSEGVKPVPRLVTQAGEVLDCASTKYMAAPTISCLNQAAGKGLRNLGVVGTACQLTGVAQSRMNPTQKEGFEDPVALTIGLFCTWSLDARKFQDLLADRVDTSTITGMDVPPPPAEIFVIRTHNGTVEIPLPEIRAIVPKGCSVCPDMTAEWADVSVGALEGSSGWNTLIIRTEKGEQLVEKAVSEGYLILDAFPDSSLENLTLGAGNKKKRAQEKADSEEK
ncbi:MAG: Coenzyme F420 hydrogenase/dehydrogenase, beta subunit C-terminal domain [bacterium]